MACVQTLSSPAYVCRVDGYTKCTHKLLCRWSVMPVHKPVVFPLCYGNTARKQKDFLHRNSLRLRDAHLYILASGTHTPSKQTHRSQSHCVCRNPFHATEPRLECSNNSKAALILLCAQRTCTNQDAACCCILGKTSIALTLNPIMPFSGTLPHFKEIILRTMLKSGQQTV